LIDQPVIEVQALAVEGAAAVRLDPGPGNGEAVRVNAQVAHQGNVFAGAVVVVAGDSRGMAVHDAARFLGEGVPAGGSAAVRLEGSFDLERGGGHTQNELRVQPLGQALQRRRVLHSHAPIIHSTVAEGNDPGSRRPHAALEGVIRFCPQNPAY